MTVGKGIFIDLRFDIDLFCRLFQSVHLYFVVEMPDIADYCLILHFLHVFEGDNVAVAGGCYIDIPFGQSVFYCFHLEAFHCRLQRAYRVDFRNNDPCAIRCHRAGAAFADVAISADHHHFTGNHNVGCAFDTVGERFAATVKVVELAFCYRIVHIYRRDKQFALFFHLIQTVHAGGRFFGHAFERFNRAMPFSVVAYQYVFDEVKDNFFFFVRRSYIQCRSIVFGFEAFVYEQSCVATVIDNQVWPFSAGKAERHCCAPPVFFQRFAFPREHGRSGLGDCRSSMILSGKDIATCPSDVRAKGGKRFDQHGSLYRHVQRAGDACTSQRFLRRIFFTDAH